MSSLMRLRKGDANLASTGGQAGTRGDEYAWFHQRRSGALRTEKHNDLDTFQSRGGRVRIHIS